MESHQLKRSGDRLTTHLESLRKKVEELGYDAYVVADEMNVRYLTNIPMPEAILLLVKRDGDYVLYATSSHSRAAKSNAGNICEIKTAKVGQPSRDLLLADLTQMNAKQIGFDALSAEAYRGLSEKAKATRFVPDAATMWGLRMIKSEDEIQNVRKSAKIADEGQKAAVRTVRPGMREYEVAAEVEHAMRILGSENEGHIYGPMVASGPRTLLGSTSGWVTDRTIGEGELVIVDTGATINGYRTDSARTYVAGKPSMNQKEMYDLVRKAWRAAFSRVRPETITSEVDVAARRVFGEYERYFDHGIGHGVGLSLPEPPRMIKDSREILKENMVVTIEPALYLDGIGGILVEDTVLVVKDGAERLTAPPLEWNA